MFEIVLGDLPGPGQLSPVMRRAAIRAALQQFHAGLRELPVIYPELTGVERAQIRLALSECVGTCNVTEDQIAAVVRVVEAQATRAAESNAAFLAGGA